MEITGSLLHVSCSRDESNFLFDWPSGRVDRPLEIIGIDSLPQLTWSSLSSKNRLTTADALSRLLYLADFTALSIFSVQYHGLI